MKTWVLAVCFFAAWPALARESYEASPSLLKPGGFILFLNNQGPLSYSAPTRREVPADAADAGEVTCKSCQNAISIPILTSLNSRSTSVSGAEGNGGYAKALLNLKKKRPDLRGIYDVKVDVQRVSILGIFTKLCTEVTARGFK